jgi:hypothetical protein
LSNSKFCEQQRLQGMFMFLDTETTGSDEEDRTFWRFETQKKNPAL